ncbi:MAG: hypothetical protein ACRDKF_16555 [Actinomycetota bacterium]
MTRLNLAEPRLVPLRSRDRAEAARLLAALMREAAAPARSRRETPGEEADAAAGLPMAPSPAGKRRTRKRAGEAA